MSPKCGHLLSVSKRITSWINDKGVDVSEWIKADEKFPGIEGTYLEKVLVWVKTMAGWEYPSFASWMPPEDGTTEFAGDKVDPRPGCWDLEDSPEHTPFIITHWMPLPEGPK